jgi:hypothetical protein
MVDRGDEFGERCPIVLVGCKIIGHEDGFPVSPSRHIISCSPTRTVLCWCPAAFLSESLANFTSRPGRAKFATNGEAAAAMSTTTFFMLPPFITKTIQEVTVTTDIQRKIDVVWSHTPTRRIK